MSFDFVDLRSSHQDSENFWPSFTDIMTVIVMIFLIASTVLIVRNWELVEQLRHSIAAEEEATEVLRFTVEENATLEEQLEQLKRQFSEQYRQLMQASEDYNSMMEQLANKEQTIAQLQTEQQELNNALTESQLKEQQLSQSLLESEAGYEKLTLDFESKTAELNESQNQLASLKNTSQEQTTELAGLRSKMQEADQKLGVMKADYSELKVKYDKLVKPARTARGKYVVEVYYEVKGKKSRIRIKHSKAGKNYQTVSSKEMHKILKGLKKKYPGKLYVKVVIPKKSGLSYSEAWTFMKVILEKYDYYY
jgi:chromosome segregation ATPase